MGGLASQVIPLSTATVSGEAVDNTQGESVKQYAGTRGEAPKNGMEVFVKSAQGQAMDSGDSLAAKAFLGEKVGEAAQLQLLHQGSNLGNDSALASCNMGDGGPLQLPVARRAGPQ